MKKVIFLLFFVVASCSIANATDYYISTSGNNANNGTSQTTPWQTLSKLETVCNNGTIKAGDNIYFKKGDSFVGQLMMTSLWGHHANSGTASQPITFSSYGTGAKPLFQYTQNSNTRIPDRIIMNFIGVDYIVVDGFNFTDLVNPVNDKFTAAYCGFAVYIGIQEEATSNHCVIKNIDVSLLGMGVAIVGDYNTLTNSSLTNFKDLVNTNNGGSDDYGANAVTITGNYNQIVNNYISSAWAYSSDYGWNGGACEMYNTCNGNKIMYNTITDCEGISEYGGETGTTAADNMIAYNKIINCGQLSWVNTTGTFAMQASNIQYFNNVIVENSLSRFSGPNTGNGNSHPLAQYPSQELFAYGGTPNASVVFNLKNNVFYLSTGIDVVRASCAAKTTHADNIYKLSGGGTPNVTLATSELSTTAAIFANITPADPLQWNFSLSTGSPAIDFGQNVGITKDFVGNPVPSIPNAGILEGATAAPVVLNVTTTAGTIACNGGTTTITVAASGGTTPYTGTGTFTVGAGTYSYTVTDASGNTKTASVTVTQPTAIGATITAANVNAANATTTASVSASGGTPGYTYALDAGAYQSGTSFSNVTVGTHSIKVKDSKNCIYTKSFTVSVILNVTTTAGTIACNGGTTTITVAASGGTTPYTGAGTFTVGAGTYSYTVTDASGNTKTASVTVTQPTAIGATITAANVNAANATTTASVSASGGTPGYTYALDAGAYQSGTSFSNVTAGTHSIKVKDSKNCIYTKSFTVSVISSTPLTISSVTGFINCYGGTTTVAISATGGIAPYTGTGTFTVAAGATSFTVTDASGATVSKTINIVQPKIIAITVATGIITTYGGTTTATISTTGGTGAYTYKLGTGSYQSSNVFSNLPAGSYSVKVKDVRGCSSVKTFIITQPAQGAFSLSLVSKSNSCYNSNNGKVTVTGAAGTLPYLYKKNGDSYSSNNVFSNLAPGTYTITGKDANGTTSSISVTIYNSSSNCGSGKGPAADYTNNTGKASEENEISGIEVTAFPNPSNSRFSLVVNSSIEEVIHITVMNLNGQKVYETKSFAGKRNVFGDSFNAGIYFTRVEQGNSVKIIKLIKTK